jgi:hypothetical protein
VIYYTLLKIVIIAIVERDITRIVRIAIARKGHYTKSSRKE